MQLKWKAKHVDVEIQLPEMTEEALAAHVDISSDEHI